MSEFERAMAQLRPQADTGRVNFNDMATQMSMEPPVPRAQDPSLIDRWSNSASQRGSSIADTLAGLTGLEEEQQEILAGRPLTPQEQLQATPSVSQAGVQMVGDVAGFIWDMGGDALTEAVTEGFSLLPQATQDATLAQLNELMQSPLGQQAVKALNAGTDAWAAFSDRYPQEAKTIEGAFNIAPIGQTIKNIRKVFPTELTPMRIEKVGARKIAQAPKGRDKDVYNLVTPEPTKKEITERIRQGNVTDPSGPTGAQRTIPSEQEWKVVDEVKKLPVSPAKTNVTNSNIVLKELDRLNQQTMNKVARTRGGVDKDVLVTDVQNALNVKKAQNPAVFGRGGKKGKETVADLQAQLNRFLDEEGTDWHGILRARQRFDNYLVDNLNAGTFGQGRKASVATEVHRAVRDTLNNHVKSNVEGTGELLERQHLLFQALDGLAPKGADEAKTAIGRLLQLANLHMPSTPASQVMTFTHPLMWAAGLGALAVSPLTLAYKTGVKPLIYAPGSRDAARFVHQSLVDFRKEMVKLGKHIPKGEMKRLYLDDMKVLASLIHAGATEDGEEG